MNPYHYFPIPAHLKDLVSLIAVMHLDFSESSMSPVYRFPWMNNTHVFFPLSDEALLVKTEGDKDFHVHKSAYFVGPKLVNDIVDFGKERHVLGITFKPGIFYKLVGIPGREVANLDIAADYIFDKKIRETEQLLRDAKGNDEVLRIAIAFIEGMAKRMKPMEPFDSAIRRLTQCNGNITVEHLAKYACKSTRQFERICKENIGMSPRLFSRLIRFGKAFSAKEASADESWISIAHRLGYYDQMHLIRDFKTFTGSTPNELNLSSSGSVKMIAALHGTADKVE